MMDDAEYRYDAFISYSHGDREWASGWLLPRLEAASLRVCIDFRDFDVGVPRLVNMERAVDHSRHTLLVLTPAWVKSEWTEFEQLLTQATDPAARRRRLLPLRLHPCVPPPRIAMLTYADFTEEGNREVGFQSLLKALKGESRLPPVGSRLMTEPVPLNSPEARLLDEVKDEVAGRLAQSLPKVGAINLLKEEQPQQVKPPLYAEVKIRNQRSTPLPPETGIFEVFDQDAIAGKLLILGAPGAGKTTTLLQLAWELVARAETDASKPIPVLCNLFSWKDDNQTLASWLVAELKLKYGVRKDIAERWLDERCLLPLLDGLDELEPTRQEKCVQTINQFQQDYRPKHLVVCCRLPEYENYGTKLQLHGAIYLTNGASFD
jgi:hypothetical protein